MHGTRLFLLAGVALAFGSGLLLASGCGEPDDPTTGVRTIVLVTPDTLGRRHVGAFAPQGGPGVTPQIDALAAQAVRFTRARAPVPLTLPSHACMLAGTPPPLTGIRTNAAPPLPPAEARSFPLLAERLRAAGWRTGAFVSAAVLAKAYGLDQGFEVYDDEGLDDPAGYSVRERAGERTVDRALDWIGSIAPAHPAFVWVHLFEPHAPYTEDGTYLGGVARVDRIVGALLQGLEARGRGDAVILLVADHGEALGELGESSHGLLLSDATLDVPFLLRAPGLAPGTDDREVRLEDVAPTLAALAGVAWPAPATRWHGYDVRGPSPPAGRLASESLYAHQLYGWAQLAGIRLEEETSVLAGEGRWRRVRRTDAAGPGLAAHEAPRAAALDQLASYMLLDPGTHQGGGTAPGYYGGDGGTASFLTAEANARLPDPYEMIASHDRLDAVKAATGGPSASSRALRGGLAELSRLAAADPQNPEIPFVRARVLAALAAHEGEDVTLLEASREAALEALRLGRGGVGTILVAVDAEARIGRARDGAEAGARAGLALLDRLEAALGEADCQLLVLRARFLADVPGEEASRARDAACARARARCTRPSEQRRLEGACAPAAER
ncbi:MAG: sulfatase [Planctomycetota bacterium]